MTDRKAQYNKKGLYNGYDKNNKEREALDYYSTPTEEVVNILNTLKIDLNNSVVLEPSAGGGHMLKGIEEYINTHQMNSRIYATDIQDRGGLNVETGRQFDFLTDKYPYSEGIDYIVMNPPYSIIEPFTMKALGIANKGVLMLGRLQFLEGEKRYLNILKDNPPTDIYVYVDRIACYRNGDTQQKMASAQAYAWFFWDFTKDNQNETICHFLRRNDKILK